MAVKQLLPATVLFSCSFISRLKVFTKPILSTKKKFCATNQSTTFQKLVGLLTTTYLEKKTPVCNCTLKSKV